VCPAVAFELAQHFPFGRREVFLQPVEFGQGVEIFAQHGVPFGAAAGVLQHGAHLVIGEVFGPAAAGGGPFGSNGKELEDCLLQVGVPGRQQPGAVQEPEIGFFGNLAGLQGLPPVGEPGPHGRLLVEPRDRAHRLQGGHGRLRGARGCALFPTGPSVLRG
jgi:hypothetical protein